MMEFVGCTLELYLEAHGSGGWDALELGGSRGGHETLVHLSAAVVTAVVPELLRTSDLREPDAAALPLDVDAEAFGKIGISPSTRAPTCPSEPLARAAGSEMARATTTNIWTTTRWQWLSRWSRPDFASRPASSGAGIHELCVSLLFLRIMGDGAAVRSCSFACLRRW